MTDPLFVCSVCGKEQKSEGETMTECRVCGRLHCGDCVDEFGRCVECAKEESKEK